MAHPVPRAGECRTIETIGVQGGGMDTLTLRRPSGAVAFEHVRMPGLRRRRRRPNRSQQIGDAPSASPQVSFELLFVHLKVKTVMMLFVLMLLEHSLLFVSEQLPLLSSCTLAITSLLAPFEWQVRPCAFREGSESKHVVAIGVRWPLR